MSRKTLQDDEKNAVCVRYAQTGSLRAVASEYGISPMRVKQFVGGRWASSSNKCCGHRVEDLRQEVETTIVRSELTGDYLERVIKARDAAIAELWARLSDAKLRRAMSDKNLIAACKTLYDMSSGAEKRQSEPNDLFMVLNQRIHNEINHNYYIQRAWNDRGRRFR